MASGRDRSDYDFNALWRGRKAGLLVDVGSESTDPVEYVEDNPPDLSSEAPLKEVYQLPEPARVIIVGTNDAKYARSTWHGYTANAFSQVPMRAVAANEHRNACTIRNTHATLGVSLGLNGDEARADGFLLPAGAEHTFAHTTEIWAALKTSTLTDNVVLSIACEYQFPID